MISTSYAPYFPQFANTGFNGGAFPGTPSFGGFGQDGFSASGELPEQRLRAYQGGGAFVFAFAAMQQTNQMNGAMSHQMGCSCQACVGVFAVGFVAYGQQSRIEEDPYGVSQSGQGQRSNLANSPEVMLAIKDIMSDGGNHTQDDVAKTLKEKYGIECEVGDITTEKDGNKTTTKGIKFSNGDYFVDGNGNGQLDVGDYKFDDAVNNIKDKYHLKDDDVKGIVDRMKENAKVKKEWQEHGGGQFGWGGGYGNQGYYAPQMLGGPFAGQQPFMGFGNQGMDQRWMMMFMQAWQMAY